MNDIVVKVEGISKMYEIGKAKQASLRDSVTNLFYNLPLISTYRRNFTKHEEGNSTDFWALKDISFELNRGDSVGIIGKNGAGKSTLLKILSRITYPTEGRISIEGKVSSLLEVGTGFHPELTGRENIYLNGTILGMKREEIKRKFDEIVDFSGIEQFINTPVKRYSSGMYVRLAFAVAAHLDPEILIIDEVLAVGDIEFQRKCFGKIKDVSSKDGRTVIFVSHSMSAIQKLCNTGILLNKGRIDAAGNIDEVVSKYLNLTDKSEAIYDINTPANMTTQRAYAYRLVIEDGDGNPVTEIPIGKSWQVRLFFKVNEPIEHFIAALGMSNSYELPIRTVFTPYQDIDKGTYEVLYKFDDVILASGKYNLIVGLSSYEKAIHYIENVAIVTISDINMLASDDRIVKTAGSGFILNPIDIKIKKILD